MIFVGECILNPILLEVFVIWALYESEYMYPNLRCLIERSNIDPMATGLRYSKKTRTLIVICGGD
jgi:hypothetical protein